MQVMVRQPLQRQYEELVQEKLISIHSVTANDVINAYKLFGLYLGGLRGKTV